MGHVKISIEGTRAHDDRGSSSRVLLLPLPVVPVLPLEIARLDTFVSTNVHNFLLWSLAGYSRDIFWFRSQAAFGTLLFGEALSLAWGLGIMLIVAGLALLHKASQTEEAKEKVS